MSIETVKSKLYCNVPTSNKDFLYTSKIEALYTILRYKEKACSLTRIYAT